jgi:hypothetical protein
MSLPPREYRRRGKSTRDPSVFLTSKCVDTIYDKRPSELREQLRCVNETKNRRFYLKKMNKNRFI